MHSASKRSGKNIWISRSKTAPWKPSSERCLQPVSQGTPTLASRHGTSKDPGHPCGCPLTFPEILRSQTCLPRFSPDSAPSSWLWTQRTPIFDPYWESTNLQNSVMELSTHVVIAINDTSCPLPTSVPVDLPGSV